MNWEQPFRNFRNESQHLREEKKVSINAQKSIERQKF